MRFEFGCRSASILNFSEDIATSGEFQLISAAYTKDFSLFFGTQNTRRFTNSCAEERIRKQ